jgi:hypothetical protein
MTPSPIVPESERELAEALAELRASGSDEAGIAPGPEVVITGSARPDPAPHLTSLSEQGETEGGDRILLSTARLSGEVEFRPRDLTVEVGAGMRMKELLRLVGANGLWLPVAGDGQERSVGGWIAAASPSIWDSEFGPVRRQLLGCRMLTTAGETLNWGRHVMKNVAGYDIPRLLAGSRGRLGVFTRVTLRLWPKPECVSVVALSGEPGWDSAEATGSDLRSWHVSQDGSRREIVAFAGSEDSVRRRRAELVGRIGTEALRTGEQVADGFSAPTGRTPGSSVYRVTPGRRYLATAVSSLTSGSASVPATVEAWPVSGSMLVRFESGSGLDRVKDLLRRPEFAERDEGPRAVGAVPAIGIERGGPVEHAWVRTRRNPSAGAIERRIEDVFGAWTRSWLADFL